MLALIGNTNKGEEEMLDIDVMFCSASVMEIDGKGLYRAKGLVVWNKQIIHMRCPT